jgi:hypothetical protein
MILNLFLFLLVFGFASERLLINDDLVIIWIGVLTAFFVLDFIVNTVNNLFEAQRSFIQDALPKLYEDEERKMMDSLTTYVNKISSIYSNAIVSEFHSEALMDLTELEKAENNYIINKAVDI